MALTECRPATGEEQIALAVAARAGDQRAKDRLFEAVERFLWKQASFHYAQLTGFSLNDLFGQACLGFCEAVKRFDAGFGKGFMTYLGWWVRHFIQKYVGEICNDPIWQEPEWGDNPSGAVRWSDSYLSEYGPHKYATSGRFERRPLEAIVSPDMDADRMATAEEVRHHLDSLPRSQREVLCYKFGLDGYPCLETYRAIARRIKRSASRVQQIADEAMAKIRGGQETNLRRRQRKAKERKATGRLAA